MWIFPVCSTTGRRTAPGEVSLNTFVITRRGLRGSCVGFITRGKAGRLQISRGTGVCLGGRGPTEDKGSVFSPCSIPGCPGDSAQAPGSSLVLQWGCPIASPSEITLIIIFLCIFSCAHQHAQLPSPNETQIPRLDGNTWETSGGSPWGTRRRWHLPRCIWGTRLQQNPDQGGVEGTQLPLCMGVMPQPVQEAPSPGLKLNRDQ